MFQDSNARMFLSNNAALFPSSNVEVFQDKNAAMSPASSATLSLDRSVMKFVKTSSGARFAMAKESKLKKFISKFYSTGFFLKK